MPRDGAASVIMGGRALVYTTVAEAEDGAQVLRLAGAAKVWAFPVASPLLGAVVMGVTTTTPLRRSSPDGPRFSRTGSLARGVGRKRPHRGVDRH